ncbi:MAG: cupin domain-containing protein [Sphingobacteriales bacterium]|nr:MAG: cupin domain-containing protein [Sphingobacteriales bacterium]
MKTAAYWIEKLGLESHIEGGAFKEIYRSAHILPQSALTTQHHGDRNTMTSIYFLLQEGDFSALHCIASDEVWHFYEGAPLCIYEITTDDILAKHLLGKDIEAGQQMVVIIKAGSWFGSRVEATGGYTLCGCTVAPGFDFADFELADREALSKEYPQYAGIIGEMTRA